MDQTPERLRQRLNQNGEKTIAFFNQLSPDEWQLSVYEDGVEWKVKDVLAHFVVAEASFCQLIENILSGGKGAPEQFDIDTFNRQEVGKLSKTPSQELLKKFQLLRQHTSGLIDKISSQDLKKVGRHPFLGEANLVDIIKLVYRHNQIHLRDLKRIIK
jgi:hypothetical protein